MIIKVNEINDTYSPDIFRLFEETSFFFKTKRPETMNEGMINQLVFNSNQKVFGIFSDEMLIGLIGLEEDAIDCDSVYTHIRCNKMNLLLDNIEYIDNRIKSIIRKYKYQKIRVYDFDCEGKKLCESLSFEIEAVFNKHIYKKNEYHNVIVYVKEIS